MEQIKKTKMRLMRGSDINCPFKTLDLKKSSSEIIRTGCLFQEEPYECFFSDEENKKRPFYRKKSALCNYPNHETCPFYLNREKFYEFLSSEINLYFNTREIANAP